MHDLFKYAFYIFAFILPSLHAYIAIICCENKFQGILYETNPCHSPNTMTMHQSVEYNAIKLWRKSYI